MNLTLMTARKTSCYAAERGGLVLLLKTTTTALQRSESFFAFLLFCFTALLLDRHQNINIFSPDSLRQVIDLNHMGKHAAGFMNFLADVITPIDRD